MADGDIYTTLQGLQTSPLETEWGIGQQALAQSLPALIDPVYGSRGTNIGIALGGALVQGLLGYQARNAAAERNVEAAKLANALSTLQTPEERLGMIESAPTRYQSGLTSLSNLLTTQALAQKQRQAQTLGDLTTAAQFKLGPLGTQLLEQEQSAALNTKLAELLAAGQFELSPIGQQLRESKLKEAATAAAIAQGYISPQFADLIPAGNTGVVPQVPGLTPKESRDLFIKKEEQRSAQEGSEGAKQQRAAVATVRDLEKTFRNLNMTGAEFKLQKEIPGSPAELAMSKLKGSLAALARISGQTSQLSDVDLQQQMDAVMGPNYFAIGTVSGTTSIADRIKQKIQNISNVVGSTSQESQTSVDSEKLQILRQLQAQLAAERAKRGM